jgi:hypothetical protein
MLLSRLLNSSSGVNLSDDFEMSGWAKLSSSFVESVVLNYSDPYTLKPKTRTAFPTSLVDSADSGSTSDGDDDRSDPGLPVGAIIGIVVAVVVVIAVVVVYFLMRRGPTSVSSSRDISGLSSGDEPGARNLESMETIDTVTLSTMSNTPDLLAGPNRGPANPAEAACIDTWAELSDEIC